MNRQDEAVLRFVKRIEATANALDAKKKIGNLKRGSEVGFFQPPTFVFFLDKI